MTRLAPLAFCAVLLSVVSASADMYPDGSNAKLPVTGAPTTQVCGTASGALVSMAGGCGINPIGNTTSWTETYGYACATAVLCAQSPHGGPGLTASTRNTDSGPNDSAQALTGWSFNYNTSLVRSGWGMYAEARRIDGAGPALTVELDATNFGTPVPINPYGMGPNQTVAAWLASGGGCGVGTYKCWQPGDPANPTPPGTGTAVARQASSAIGIIPNGAPFLAGIVVANGALDPGVGGWSSRGRFAHLPAGAGIEWASSATVGIGNLSADATSVGNPSLLWTGFNPQFTLQGTEGGGHDFTIKEAAGTIVFQDLTGPATLDFRGSTGATIFEINAAGILTGGSLKVTGIATSAGAGGLYVCVDSAGLTYKKAVCP